MCLFSELLTQINYTFLSHVRIKGTIEQSCFFTQNGIFRSVKRH